MYLGWKAIQNKGVSNENFCKNNHFSSRGNLHTNRRTDYKTAARSAVLGWPSKDVYPFQLQRTSYQFAVFNFPRKGWSNS